MKLEIHILQSFPPRNLNRDENGMPKSCIFGGHPRARISSQCQKRAVRLFYQENTSLSDRDLASRSRAWMPELREVLIQSGGADTAQATIAAKLALEKLGAKIEGEKVESNTILFLGRTEIAAIADLLSKNWSDLAPKLHGDKPELPKDLGNAIEKALRSGGKPGDVALFGRMMAALPTVNVDAAVQVAHAIGVNALQQEFDFFTAVDDLAASDDAGADHMGETGYNSATYYRFANLDTHQLTKNLGSAAGADTIARAFAEAFVKAIPSGHQNSFAAHSLPALVLMVVRRGQPISLVDAFENPVRPKAGLSLLDRSIQNLDRHWADLCTMYGDGGKAYVGIVTRQQLQQHLHHLKNNQKASLDVLISGAIAAAFSAERGDA
ncbi:MAG: type I-E CRISPR-associated protein Cas7/Cse4/CasC [Oscillatoriales cyanobacterium SM2_1_8]|nr:type I-E CRISPR-associated protein Cas7/Cse4/CasC [Oscillatoriales cyanobacterium SM2_1_8]